VTSDPGSEIGGHVSMTAVVSLKADLENVMSGNIAGADREL
jgi:hypothetical protein